MKCKNCGYENPDASKYCGQCGWELSKKVEARKGLQNDKQETKANRNGRPIKWLLLGIGALLVAVLMISLFSGPSVADVEAEIDTIGTVNINSTEHIQEILEMCKSLSVEEQEKIRNIDVLMAASEELARQAEVMADASDAICALGEITLDSKAAVASAREKYDQAKVYDLNHIMAEHEAMLEAAEAELEALIKEQEQSLEYALSDVGNVTSHFFTGDYSWGESSFQAQIEKLNKKNDRQQYADAVMEQICAWAQTSYEKGSYVAAVTVLQNSAAVLQACGADAVATAENLEASFIQKLNSKAPKNGEVLEKTFGKGTNSLTLTAGPADTCVKIQSVNDHEKYAIMYIKANEKATLYNIKSDEYKVMYTTGPVWFGEEELFGAAATFILYPDTINPQATPTGNGRQWMTYTGTLTVGYGDEYGIQNMNPSDF